MQINDFSMQKVSTNRVGTDSSKFCPLAGTENSTQWYSQYHGQVTSLPLSGIDAFCVVYRLIVHDVLGACQCKVNMIADIILAQQLLEIVALQYGFNLWIDA